MTITSHAYARIRVSAGSGPIPFDGKPRFRSTAKPTGELPLIDMRKASEAAAMSLRHRVFTRRCE